MIFKIHFLPKFIFSLALLLASCSLFGQYQDDYVIPEFKNIDYNYRGFISSVRFATSESEIDYPIIQLNSGSHLLLEFDDLEADNKNYTYKVIHCNYDWTPSEDIAPMDYIDGFQENRIYESTNSFGTRTEYIHYQIKIPNDDIKITKSGNYILKVYIDGEEEDLAITRRFVIYEPMMKAVPHVRRSAVPPYSRSHQEFSLKVEHVGIYLPNPAKDIKVAILQNGRWDNAITNINPTFIKNEEMNYDLQGQIIFPGFREFRPLDIRSFRHRGPQVETMEQNDDNFQLYLFNDIPRTHAPYLFTNDLNGKFIVSSYDNPAANERGEYGHVHFNLETPKLSDSDVYVVGGFSDFLPYLRYKMTYNEEKEAYTSNCLLKNGFYDYMYLAVNKETGKPDLQALEGSVFESENNYVFLVYYRKYGSRYDQVVAYSKISSSMR